MWLVFVLSGISLAILGFVAAVGSPLSAALTIVASGIAAGSMLVIIGLLMWHLTRIEQRLQDIAMIALAAQKPEHLDDVVRAIRLKRAIERTWEQDV